MKTLLRYAALFVLASCGQNLLVLENGSQTMFEESPAGEGLSAALNPTPIRSQIELSDANGEKSTSVDTTQSDADLLHEVRPSLAFDISRDGTARGNSKTYELLLTRDQFDQLSSAEFESSLQKTLSQARREGAETVHFSFGSQSMFISDRINEYFKSNQLFKFNDSEWRQIREDLDAHERIHKGFGVAFKVSFDF